MVFPKRKPAGKWFSVVSGLFLSLVPFRGWSGVPRAIDGVKCYISYGKHCTHIYWHKMVSDVCFISYQTNDDYSWRW